MKAQTSSTSQRHRRRGAALAEAAIVLTVFVVTMFVMLDLAIAVARHNALADSARLAARTAIVRGDKAAVPLGPGEWSGTAASASPVAEMIRARLWTMQPGDVHVHLSWPDGEATVGKRVHVELTYAHAPLFSELFGAWTLRATSTMRIVH